MKDIELKIKFDDGTEYSEMFASIQKASEKVYDIKKIGCHLFDDDNKTIKLFFPHMIKNIQITPKEYISKPVKLLSGLGDF